MAIAAVYSFVTQRCRCSHGDECCCTELKYVLSYERVRDRIGCGVKSKERTSSVTQFVCLNCSTGTGGPATSLQCLGECHSYLAPGRTSQHNAITSWSHRERSFCVPLLWWCQRLLCGRVMPNAITLSGHFHICTLAAVAGSG